MHNLVSKLQYRWTHLLMLLLTSHLGGWFGGFIIAWRSAFRGENKCLQDVSCRNEKRTLKWTWHMQKISLFLNSDFLNSMSPTFLGWNRVPQLLHPYPDCRFANLIFLTVLEEVLTVLEEVDGLRFASGFRLTQRCADGSFQTRESRGQRLGETRLHLHVVVQTPVLISLEWRVSHQDLQCRCRSAADVGVTSNL